MVRTAGHASGAARTCTCPGLTPARAVSDPTLRAILDLLAESDRSAGAVARDFDLCQSTVSEHLAVLRRVRLAAYKERAGRSYSLAADPLREVVDWALRLAPLP